MEIPALVSNGYRIFDQFDVNDPKNLGRPFFFDLKLYIAAIEMMICSDEIERALWMIDNPPAWYRENYPDELKRMKKILYENMYDQYEYAADPDEAGWKREDAEAQWRTAYTYPRAEILADIVAGYNRQGKTPWVCEFSPSHGLLPLGLAKEGHKFHFFGKNLNHMALAKLIEWLGNDVWAPRGPSVDQPTIFVNTECLEHAMREKDLYESFMKMDMTFDHIVLSVPLGTLGGGLPNWKTRRIGHVRAYTQSEFHKLAVEFFPGYEWTCYRSSSMVLHGKKP